MFIKTFVIRVVENLGVKIGLDYPSTNNNYQIRAYFYKIFEPTLSVVNLIYFRHLNFNEVFDTNIRYIFIIHAPDKAKKKYC